MSRSKLYNLTFKVKRIQFEPKITTELEVTTVNVKFLDHPHQMLFEPVIPPASGTLILNAGKTFTFGLDHDTESDLAKHFVIQLYLEQTDLKKCLSEAQIDLTNIFRGVYKNRCLSNVKSQMNSAVEFADHAGETMAHMDVMVRLFPCGPTIVNEFVLNSGHHQKHRISVRNKCARRRHPKAPAAGPGGRDDDEGEWDVVCAELDNGQKIAVKYHRSYYGLLPTAGDEDEEEEEEGDDDGRCTNARSDVTTRSGDRLDGRLFELMRGMHETIAKRFAGQCVDDDGSGYHDYRAADERLPRAREPTGDKDDRRPEKKVTTTTAALGSAVDPSCCRPAKPGWKPKLLDGRSGYRHTVE